MKDKPIVAIIMGSNSDLSIMKDASDALNHFSIAHSIEIVSAHRTPQRMLEFGEIAISKGYKVIIAGAGGAAHLPGMVAAITTLPVIGVPVKSSNSLDGWDSLLSIAQMPKGVPVATVAVNGAYNAGLLAVQILATADPSLQNELALFKEQQKEKVQLMNDQLK